MLYWRLSSFYLIYFTSLGVLLPYWGLYLHSLGFDAQTIGQLVAIPMATKIIAPTLWSWIADRTGEHVRLIRLGSIGALFCFLGVFYVEHFLAFVTVMIGFSFFWNACIPQMEVTTLAHLGEKKHQYTRIRLWGSIGFIITVTTTGYLLDKYGVYLVPYLLASTFALIFIASFTVPAPPEHTLANTTATTHKADSVIFWQLLKRRPVIVLIIAFFLMQASHTPYYTFFTLHLEENHYSREIIGYLWALSVAAEVIVFWGMHHLLRHFQLKTLLILCFALAAIRWLVVGYYAELMIVIVFSQLLHAASFGLYHGVAVQFMHHYFIGNTSSRGQALYSGLGYGAGGAMGTWLSGYSWSFLGAQISFTLAALLCIIAMILCAWGLEEIKTGKNKLT
ncbi:arabinose efflux permease family protein [Beggiatoa alba B18LD]|uniref:Arabinose efflux permease family protein n=1 Tax=Beggiatoa alba B18LD TaxID=395493 RepID=I3CGK6_9GAMM|nr:MFS transporter [Beggiatoa alba]EIJ42749.1 arabinose efflux permease family protein [Beggiatoa alba B18LD]